jgi:hypothetical protein
MILFLPITCIHAENESRCTQNAKRPSCRVQPAITLLVVELSPSERAENPRAEECQLLENDHLRGLARVQQIQKPHSARVWVAIKVSCHGCILSRVRS